jgi:hypothetical protein
MAIQTCVYLNYGDSLLNTAIMPNDVLWSDCPVLLFPVTHQVTQRGNRRAQTYFEEDD